MSKSTVYPLSHVLREGRRAPALASVLARLTEPVRRLRAVNELERLSDRQLRDIGIERRQIEAIAEREIRRLRTR